MRCYWRALLALTLGILLPPLSTDAQSFKHAPLEALAITIQLPPTWLMERTEKGYAFAPPEKTYAVAIAEDRTYTYEEAVARLPYGIDLGDGTFIVTSSPFEELSSGAIHAEALMGNLFKQVKVGVALWKLGSGRMIFALAIPMSEDHYANAREAMLDLLGSAREMTETELAADSRNSPHAAGMSELLRKWDERLRRSRVQRYDSYNSGSGGGLSSETQIDLCSDGSYTWYGQSSVSMDVDGASGGSGGQSGDRGRWELRESGSKALLVFHSESGSTKKYVLKRGDKSYEIFLDGRRYLVSQARDNTGPACE
jgi:hypothetical protein